MLKVTKDVYYNIKRHMVDSDAKAIDLYVETGDMVDGKFKSDNRDLIPLSIVNIPDQPEIDLGDGNIIPAVAGRAWFDEQAAYVQSENPEHLGKDDYTYLKDRLWQTVVNMGLISGEII
jgi:hypothetical protein